MMLGFLLGNQHPHLASGFYLADWDLIWVADPQGVLVTLAWDTPSLGHSFQRCCGDGGESS